MRLPINFSNIPCPSKLTLCLVTLLIFSAELCVAEAKLEAIKTDSSTSEQSEEAEATTVAPNLDLKKVAPLPEAVAESEDIKEPETNNNVENIGIKDDEKSVKDTQQEPTQLKPQKIAREKLVILGSEIPENSSTRLAWSPQITISGSFTDSRVSHQWCEIGAHSVLNQCHSW